MITGFTYPLKGFRLLLQRGFKRYAAAPLLINVLVFASLYGFGLYWIFNHFYPITFELPTWLAWLQSSLGWLLEGLFWIGFVLIALTLLLTLGQLSSLIASIIASPFNSLMVEKIYQAKGVNIPDATWGKIAKEAIHRESAKLLYLLPRIVLVYGLFAFGYFIPVVNLFTSTLLLIFSCWLLSFESIDYAAETDSTSIKSMRGWLKQNRSLTMSFGFSCATLSSVPILNLIAMPSQVAGGALLWLDNRKQMMKSLT